MTTKKGRDPFTRNNNPFDWKKESAAAVSVEEIYERERRPAEYDIQKHHAHRKKRRSKERVSLLRAGSSF